MATSSSIVVPAPKAPVSYDQSTTEANHQARMTSIWKKLKRQAKAGNLGKAAQVVAAPQSKLYTVDKKELLLMIGCVASLIFTKFSIDNLKTCEIINSVEVINSTSKNSCDSYIVKAVLGVFVSSIAALAFVDPNKDVPYPYVYVKNKA